MPLSWEPVRIRGENITPDLLLWRRYKRPFGNLQAVMEAANPQMTYALAQGPFIPVGMVVSIPIDTEILNGTPVQQRVVKLYGMG